MKVQFTAAYASDMGKFGNSLPKAAREVLKHESPYCQELLK